jgi:hypothetical protein
VPDRQDTNHLARFVDLVNDPVYVAFRAVKQMPQPSFGLFAFGSCRAAAGQPFELRDRPFDPVEPTGSSLWIVCRDPLIEVVEVSLCADVNSTRYAMAPAQLVEHLAGRARPSVGDIVHALPDSLVNVGAGRPIEQFLIGFRVLHYGLGLAVDG